MKNNELEEAWTLLEEAMNENKTQNTVSPQNEKKEEVKNGNADNRHKRKLEEINGDNTVEEPSTKKKNIEAVVPIEEPLIDDSLKEIVPEKFSWGETIRNILSAKNNELKLKKLRNKIVKKYQSLTGGEWSDKLESKFNKKVNKLKGVVVEDEKVRLIEV